MYFLRCINRKGAIHSALKFRSLNAMAQRNFIQLEENPGKDYATVYMNRKPANGLNLEFICEITSTIKELEAKKCKGFVLTSRLETIFSAGLDIKEILDPQTDRFVAFWKAFQEMWKTLYLTPMVTVAAINGNAPAGGCMLALSCDYKIMLKCESIIGINAVNLGIVTPRWIQQLMINCMGFHNTEKSLELGVLYKPEQALAMNFVDELVDDSSQLLSTAYDKMEQYLRVNDFARRTTKMNLRKPLVDELNRYEQDELTETMRLFQGDEIKKVLSNYLEKLKAKNR